MSWLRASICGASLLAGSFGVGCSMSPGGPPAVYMSVSVVDESGTEHPRLCTQFPVLVGSRVADKWTVGGDLTVEVELTRHVAEVTLLGREKTTLTYSRDQVEAGILGDPIEVEGLRRSYEVTIHSGCL